MQLSFSKFTKCVAHLSFHWQVNSDFERNFKCKGEGELTKWEFYHEAAEYDSIASCRCMSCNESVIVQLSDVPKPLCANCNMDILESTPCAHGRCNICAGKCAKCKPPAPIIIPLEFAFGPNPEIACPKIAVNIEKEEEVLCVLAKNLKLESKEEKLDHASQNTLGDVCRIANLELAKKLLDAGADVNETNDRGSTPLHRACCSQEKDVYEICDLIEFLLEKGANPNAHECGYTPLIWFYYNCPVDDPLCMAMTRCFFKHGADVNIQDVFGYTALHYICCRGYFMTAYVLVTKCNADCTLKNRYGQTAIDSAILHKHKDLAKKLEEWKREENPPEDMRKPPLLSEESIGKLSELIFCASCKISYSPKDHEKCPMCATFENGIPPRIVGNKLREMCNNFEKKRSEAWEIFKKVAGHLTQVWGIRTDSKMLIAVAIDEDDGKKAVLYINNRIGANVVKLFILDIANSKRAIPFDLFMPEYDEKVLAGLIQNHLKQLEYTKHMKNLAKN